MPNADQPDANITLTLQQALARRGNDLAAVRFLGATTVLYAHAFVVKVPHVAQATFFTHVFGFAADTHAVHAFFILSGLLLTRSLMAKPDALRFIVARLVRYLPAIFVASAAMALILGPLVTTLPVGTYFASGAPFRFIAEVTSLARIENALPGVFAGNPKPGILFTPLWTVRYELAFMLALACAFALGLLRDRRIVLGGLAIAAVVNVVWFWNGEAHADLGTPHHLVRFGSTFAIGVALALYADRIPLHNKALLIVALLTLPLAFSPVAALAGMILMATAVLFIGFRGGALTRALATIGVWSYGFYVWGYGIEQTIEFAWPQLPGEVIFLITLPVSLLAGALSWRFVEKPAIARTDAITKMVTRRLAALRPA